MKCTKCVAHKNKEGINCQRYFGTAPCRFLFYGEMFGKEECRRKEPFVGSAGKILIRLLELIGLIKSDVCISNVCKCYIADNQTPTKAILDSCFIHISREIQEITPDLIIAMGASACYSLTGIPTDEFKYYRGKLIHSLKINRKVFITYHPAAILYDTSKKDKIEKDFLKIPDLLDETPEEAKYYDYTLVDTQDKFDTMFDILYKNPMFFDMETEGLDPYDKNLNIRTLQLGKDEDNIFVLIPEIIYSNVEGLKRLFDECPVIGQDFAFDVKWLFVKLGIFPKIWYYDTCLAEFIICGMKNNNLIFTTGKYNPDYYGYWKNIPKGGSHLVQDREELYKYGASDVGTMYPIHIRQQKLLFKERQQWLFNNITMPCNKVLTKMSLRGVKVDLDVLQKLDNKYGLRAEKVLNQALILPGIKECESHFNQRFNPRSTVMTRWLLINYYKLPVLNKTLPSKLHKEGQAKVSQKEMELYSKKPHYNKYCKKMMNYGSIQTVRKNFLSGSVPKLKNGVAHTTYSLHATATGRPNSKEPNLLNYPAKDDYKDIKKCLVPREGFKFLVADMSQIEMRIASVIYNDQNLIDLCNEEGRDDFHSLITAKVYGKTYDEIYIPYSKKEKKAVELRRICKSISFGILYQQGKKALSYAMGVPESKAETFIREYFDMFPELERNIRRIKEFVVKYGHVDTYFRFRRYFKYHTWEDHETLREAVNTPIQGTAWNLMQLSLIEIDRVLEEREMKSGIVMQIYDAVVVETAKEEVAEVANIISSVMENINKPYDGLNKVKIKIDLERGMNLADLKRYEN